jgi:hypothetical protein
MVRGIATKSVMIRASRTLEAVIGGRETVKYRLSLDAEHAQMLAKILDITRLVPATWLAKVLREELIGLGVSLPPDPGDWEEQWEALLSKHKENPQDETPKSTTEAPRQTTIPGT